MVDGEFSWSDPMGSVVGKSVIHAFSSPERGIVYASRLEGGYGIWSSGGEALFRTRVPPPREYRDGEVGELLPQDVPQDF